MKSINEISMQNIAPSIKKEQNAVEYFFCIYDYMLNENTDVSLFKYILLFFEYANLICYIFKGEVSKLNNNNIIFI